MTRLAIIALAAGSSRRFGSADKMLALVDGEPLVVRVIRRLCAVSLESVVVEVIAVVPSLDGDVARAIRDAVPTVRLVANPSHRMGLGTSVAAGVTSLCPDIEGALITPSDLPGLETAFTARLLTEFCQAGLGRPVHAELSDGTAVSPMVWPRRIFPALAGLSGDAGGRALLPGSEPIAVAIPAEQAADVDVPRDLDTFSARLGAPPTGSSPTLQSIDGVAAAPQSDINGP
ncbi:MAG: NTP transferase domain-containing protein [Hyphomicrobiaceae bacterium]|nr:NTP transferase domain-containing protein [Hyphomicrobiaceae bacterium]